MMSEIFLNALVIAYAIYHTAVVFGWTLLLFDIYNDKSDQSSCPENPGLSNITLNLYPIAVFGIFFN